MTSRNLPLHEIRRLLDLYYDGSATAAEEASLTRYFLEHPDVPADLRTDRDLFVALHRAAALTPPADLLDRVTYATCGPAVPRRRPVGLFIFSAAAAMALILTVAIAVINFTPSSPSVSDTGGALPDESLLSTLVNHTDTILNVDSVAAPPRHAAPKLATAAIHRDHARKAARNARRDAARRDTLSPEQATAVVDELLARSFKTASMHVEQARENFNNIETTIHRISK